MRTNILKQLSLLNGALSTEYYDYLLNVFTSFRESKINLILNIYSSFCYLIKPRNYTAIDIFSNEVEFNNHFELLVGYVYYEIQGSDKSKYGYLCELKKGFKKIAEDKNLAFRNLKLPLFDLSDEALYCIEKYSELNVDKDKINYLNGWKVFSKDGTEIELHLNSIYIVYGVKFTQKIHQAFTDYALKKKTETARYNVTNFKSFIDIMVQICPDSNIIYKLLSSTHVQGFFHDIMNVWFASHLAKGNEPKTFFLFWKNAVSLYSECFIDARIFDAPAKPFIVPRWKSPQNSALTFSIGGQATKKEKERWFVDIPIKIKDEEAIAIIYSRINTDLTYIRHVCMTKFNELKERDKRNTSLIRIGSVKPLPSAISSTKYRGFVGEKNLANTIATFHAHGFYSKRHNDYAEFLGFKGKASILLKELNLPTASTLAVISTLLVIEHPQITPAWLEKWELFDKNGKQVGFKKSNNQYLIVSYKDRKGYTNAHQAIVLNDFSIELVEFLIKHTSLPRRHLKARGNPAWRKMLLTAKLTAVYSVSQIGNLERATGYLNWLGSPSLFGYDSLMTQTKAKKLADLISLRSIRKHRGLQIYLETRSMTAVAEALGHKELDLTLLASYLPGPLMDFFNERWIRQFQNAILLEAMKGSEYLLDTVDLTAEGIEEFLSNHGLGHLPSHSDHGFQKKTYDDIKRKSYFDEMTFMISTSLLQLLIAIKNIVENDENRHNFLDIVNDWYQSAVFVLSSLSKEQYNTDADLTLMLHEASVNPLDINLIRGALTC